MAIYHLRVSVISRSQGRSATAAIAYRVAERIADRRTGLVFDYAAKAGVEHAEILAPSHAPDWVHDRSELWNRVEEAETRKNSQVAREVRVALPGRADPCGAGRAGAGVRLRAVRGPGHGGGRGAARPRQGGGRPQPPCAHPPDHPGGRRRRVHRQEPRLEQGRAADRAGGRPGRGT